MVKILANAGFDGVYIDSYGYQDSGAEIIKRLSTLLGRGHLVSQNNRLYFFDIKDFKERLARSPSREDAGLFGTTMAVWAGGFSGLEGTAEANWRWCSSNGELLLYNMVNMTRNVSIETTIYTGYDEPAELKITSQSFSETLMVINSGKAYSRVVTISPGVNRIEFDCDGKRVNAPSDPRVLVFRLANFRIIE